VPLAVTPDWRTLARGGTIALPLDANVDELFRTAGSPGSRPRFQLAGPIEIHRARKGVLQALPVFLVSVVATREQGRLILKAEVPARVNEAWLDCQFPKSRSDLRENLLVSLGIYNERFVEEGVDVVPGSERTVEELWQALAALQGDRFVESGGPHQVRVEPTINKRSNPGLYHRAYLLANSDSPFFAGLLAELRVLATAPDDDLRGTALSAFFEPQPSAPKPDATALSTRVLPEFQPLNPEQREVVRLSFEAPILAVQGPPGTGKSTVVTHVLSAHALAGQSALFASRNHRALEAVVPRLRAIDEDRPLILRLTKSLSNPGDGGDDWLRALLDLLGRPGDPDEVSRAASRQNDLRDALRVRERCESELGAELEHAGTLAAANEDRADLELELGPKWTGLSEASSAEASVVRLERCILQIESQAQGIWSRLRGTIARRWVRRALRRSFASLDSSSNWTPPEIPDDLRTARLLLLSGKLGKTQQAITVLERQAQALPARELLVEALSQADDRVRVDTRRALEGLAASQGVGMSDKKRARLMNIRGELGSRRTAGSIHRLPPRLRTAVERAFEGAIEVFPLWACSNLSVRSRLPLVPAAFDLVVIDEASQCDIPSCLPLLYRAKRAMIVGDPMQLRHVGKVGQEVEDRLRDQNQLDGVEFGRFRYSTNSIWEPAFAAAHRTGGDSRMLKEHWRCHPAIAGYFSTLFYDGKLRIRTIEENYPPLVRGERKLRGIEWTHVPGGSESTPGGSRFYGPQITAIVDELLRVHESGYEGTVGVVTPFRAHADRIMDEVAQRIPREVLKKWSFASETADGFQGDERDLILFGLIGGPLPADTPAFYLRDKNRFNVAVSRARSLLHVFGDQEWASNSSERVLSELADAWRKWQRKSEQPVREDLIGPVWEPKLAEALSEANMDYFQQYRACGYYLDFALIRGNFRLCVEVDGETYHRGPDGGRKVEDLRRDQTLRAAGWQVLRFWVYELREDLGNCIDRIRGVLDGVENGEA
jgi:very-short-patch-repair endonuclease